MAYSGKPLKNGNDLIADAISYLQEGDEIKAQEALNQARRLNPKSLMANKLLEQINSDPMVSLGESHSEYKLQVGETISGLAQRFLGDSLLFHILARYNNIQKPKYVRAGQLIKIPNRVTTLKDSPQEFQMSYVDAGKANTDEEQAEPTGNITEQATIANEPLVLPLEEPITIDLAKPTQLEQRLQLENQALILIKKKKYQQVIDLLKPEIAERTMGHIDKTLIVNLLAEAYLSSGEQLANQQLYAEAIEKMTEVLQLDMNNEPAKIKKQAYHSTLKADQYYLQGQKALLARRFQEAITAFSQVMQFRPNHLDSQQKLTQAKKKLAAEYYNQAIKLRRRQRLNDAIVVLDKVLILDPENINAKKHRDEIAKMIDKLAGIKK